MRSLLLPSLLAALAGAAALAAPARAQDAPPPPAPAPSTGGGDRAERLRLARERWERLPPEEREKLRRRFEAFQKLPQEKRDALRSRFEDVGGREGAALVRRRLDDLRRRSPEQVERMRLQADAIRHIEDRLAENLPPRFEKSLRALHPEARDRLRRRFTERVLSVGREEALRKYATEEERAAARGDDPAKRKDAFQSFRHRMRERVLAPHRAAIDALPPGERRKREFHLVEADFWSGVDARFAEVRAAFHRSLDGPAGPNGKTHAPSPEAREKFARTFGIAHESLPPWGPKALWRAAGLVPPDGREAYLQEIRPELARIAGLPAGEREAALRVLLERPRNR